MTDPDTIEVEPRPCWVAGKPEPGTATRTVRHPADGTEVAEVVVPSPDQVERAVAAAAAVAAELGRSPAHQRAEALELVAELVSARAEEIAETITAENGSPLLWAQTEVATAAAACTTAAALARTLSGRTERLDTEPAGEGRLALTARRPRGPVLVLGGTADPFGLVVRQAAAALAVGAPVLVKPAAATPLSALLLGEVLAEAGLPPGAFAVLPLDRAGAAGLVADPRLPVLAAGGSAATATALAAAAPAKHLVAEPAGGSAAFVAADWSDPADLDFAASRIATYGCAQGGRARAAVRRVLVHRAVAAGFTPRLVAALRALNTGDPHDPEVEVGPLPGAEQAERVVAAVTAAVAAGATVLCGGGRDGSTVAPTLLTGVGEGTVLDPAGPVLLLSVVDDLAAAGIGDAVAAGVFTHHTRTAFALAAGLAVDEVLIGDVPTARPGAVAATARALTREQTVVLTDVAR